MQNVEDRRRRSTVPHGNGSGTRHPAQSDRAVGADRADQARHAKETKTLLELLEQRQLLNSSDSQHQISTVHGDDDVAIAARRFAVRNTLDPDEHIRNRQTTDRSQSTPTPTPTTIPTPLWLDIALYTITLTGLHFTFTMLVMHQYGQGPPDIRQLLHDNVIVSPTPWLLACLVGLLHPFASRPTVQTLFLGMGILTGASLVHVCNRENYLATMQKAPALGTVWVWTVLEMKWHLAATSLLIVLLWTYWMDYRMY